MQIDPVNNKRPVNLDLPTVVRQPFPALISITHRVSGVFLLVGVGFLLYLLQESFSSPSSFAELQSLLDGVGVRLFLWLVVSALLYHWVAGVRHLLMDIGVGETLRGGRFGAMAVAAISAVLIALAGVWLWS